MDNPQSDDELRREIEAGAEETMLSKKMKLLIIMLSLVLIILLLPLARDHGLPLLQPMGISVLQRLWDAMRFIAMTAAISVGIISTSSQKNDKGRDRSAHHRSTYSSIGRSSISSSSRHEVEAGLGMNQSVRTSFSVHRDVNPEPHIIKERGGKDLGNVQKLKGKEVMNEFSALSSRRAGDPASSPGGAPYMGEEGINSLQSPNSTRRANNYPPQAANQDPDLMYNYWQQKAPIRPQGSFMLGAAASDDAWLSCASTMRIDEEKEEDQPTSAGASSSRSRGFSSSSSSSSSSGQSLPEISNSWNIEAQATAAGDHLHELGIIRSIINKDASKSPDHRGIMNNYNGAYTSIMTDDNYADLRMRKATISRLVDENYPDASAKAHRRSSSVDRRRPNIHYDDRGPDAPGLKQILMNAASLTDQRAANHGKRSNLSPSNSADVTNSRNAGGKQSDTRTHAHSAQASARTTNPSMQQQSEKVRTNQPIITDALPAATSANLNRTAQPASAATAAVAQNAAARQQKPLVMRPDQQKINKTSQKQATGAKAVGGPSHIKTQSLIIEQGKAHLSKLDVLAPTRLQDDRQAGADATASRGSRSRDEKAGCGAQSAREYEENVQLSCITHDVPKAETPSRSKFLLQSSKHSRSAVSLAQLEQRAAGDSVHVHASTPPPAGTSSSTARRKKSYSCDFGDGLNPEWLWKLEPPPPPGMSDQANAESNRGTSPASSGTTLVQTLLPWRSTAPIDISAYPRAASPLSPPDVLSHQYATGLSTAEVNQRADEFISNFTSRLMRQRQQSLERQKRYEHSDFSKKSDN